MENHFVSDFDRKFRDFKAAVVVVPQMLREVEVLIDITVFEHMLAFLFVPHVMRVIEVSEGFVR